MKSVFNVFWRFFVLGWFSFGGPTAHIGYFRNTFVQKLRWVDDNTYAQIIALSQFLPGPGSSQVGFALGYRQAGVFGGFAAFLGFTLPSFLLMLGLAVFSQQLGGDSLMQGVIKGLTLLAVVVVADAVSGMFKSFCQNSVSVGIAIIAAAGLWLFPMLMTQLVLLAAAAVFGVTVLGGDKTLQASKLKVSEAINWKAFLLFLLLFVGLPLLLLGTSQDLPQLQLFADFYQAGSLVFGGGHVVLPLLEKLLEGDISTDQFLLGYSAAQGVPGPMFSIASFLGAEVSSQPDGSLWPMVVGALIATAGIFLPGFLLIMSFQGMWESLSAKPRFQGMVKALNATVVGLLIAALYQPVFTHAVSSSMDMAFVAIGFFCLRYLKLPIVLIVLVFAGLGVGIQEGHL